MLEYLMRRVLISISVLILITFIIFVLLEISPGDIADYFVGPEITLCWVDDRGNTTLDYRPVHMYTLSDEIEPVPPKARTY